MSILVVGGGLTGLTAAWVLAREGVPVMLAEPGPRLGGKVATEQVDGFVVEAGPDSFVTARPAALALVQELGLGGEVIGTRQPRVVYVRHRGTLVPIPEGLGLVLPTRLMPFVRTPLFGWSEKLRMALDLVAPRRLAPEDVAVGELLRARLGDALVERLAGPLVGGVYGTPIDELSLDAVVPQLRTAEQEHRSLLLAGLADGRRRRRSPHPPSGHASPPGLFVSLRGGLSRLTDAVAAAGTRAGAGLRTGLGVTGLGRSGAGASARFSDGTSARFDSVVIATPAPVAARLLEEELPTAARALEAIPHGTGTLVTLAFPPGASDREPLGHGYLVPRSEGGLIAACTWTSEKWPGRAPDDALLLRLFLRDEHGSTALEDEALITLARAEVRRSLGIEREPLFVRVARYDASMPRYTVGHLGRIAAIEQALEAWPAVTLAGASYRGIGLPDCVAQARSAATRVLERISDRRAA